MRWKIVSNHIQYATIVRSRSFHQERIASESTHNATTRRLVSSFLRFGTFKILPVCQLLDEAKYLAHVLKEPAAITFSGGQKDGCT
eukprot:scaffold15068_cov193-Alexandrium_tamarense.AAC.10